MDTTNYITLRDAAEMLPGKPHPSTLHRWCKRGVAVPGNRIRLGSISVGWTVYTTPEWLAAFIANVSAARAVCPTPIRGRPGVVTAAHAAAENEMIAAGL